MDFKYKRTWGPEPKFPRVEAYSLDLPFVFVAGPCSVESKEQIEKIARFVAANGATHLRGGVFRAGTYPGKEFGLKEKEADHLSGSAFVGLSDEDENELKTVIEIIDLNNQLDQSPGFAGDIFTCDHADVWQIGARQMQNYPLLRELGERARQEDKTIFLKRHPGSTIFEWLGAAEHILAGANCDIPLYLIERGSSTHMNHVRWDLSISAIPAIAKLSKIPVICDASHGTGRRDLVLPMAKAGLAAGARGLLIETHYDPPNSLSDADQAIDFDQFAKLGTWVKKWHEFSLANP